MRTISQTITFHFSLLVSFAMASMGNKFNGTISSRWMREITDFVLLGTKNRSKLSEQHHTRSGGRCDDTLSATDSVSLCSGNGSETVATDTLCDEAQEPPSQQLTSHTPPPRRQAACDNCLREGEPHGPRMVRFDDDNSIVIHHDPSHFTPVECEAYWYNAHDLEAFQKEVDKSVYKLFLSRAKKSSHRHRLRESLAQSYQYSHSFKSEQGLRNGFSVELREMLAVEYAQFDDLVGLERPLAKLLRGEGKQRFSRLILENVTYMSHTTVSTAITYRRVCTAMMSRPFRSLSHELAVAHHLAISPVEE